MSCSCWGLVVRGCGHERREAGELQLRGALAGLALRRQCLGQRRVGMEAVRTGLRTGFAGAGMAGGNSSVLVFWCDVFFCLAEAASDV